MIIIREKIKLKVLDKLFEIGICDEKDISNMQIEQLIEIKNLTILDIFVIIGFRQAIREKRFLLYLHKNDETKKEDYINGI